MKIYNLIYFLFPFLMILSCSKEEPNPSIIPIEETPINFSVNEDYILLNNDPFLIKGVVYVPGYPGYLPWEIERSTTLPANLGESIVTDLANIKALGANTVRLWGAPKYAYEVIKSMGDLYFLQTIWIDGAAPDFQNSDFKQTTKSYIREIIDRIYSVYSDKNPPLIAYLIGNELSESGILATNAAHPDINSFTGNYIQVENINASEAFIAEMADYARTYEFDTYGRKTLLSYANEIRTYDLIDISFLDFVSHNAYSYAVPYYRPGTVTGSTSGTQFQGWVEEVKNQHPNKPLLITETGLSVSPNATHVGPPNYGYGGNTETEQAQGLVQNIRDINSVQLPLAGVCIHEYLDAWWKFSLEDSYSQDPNDIEEWFGLVRLTKTSDWYTTEFREAYQSIQNEW